MKKKFFTKPSPSLPNFPNRVFRAKTSLKDLTNAQKARLFNRIARGGVFYNVEPYKINEQKAWTKENTFLYESGKDIVDITLYSSLGVHLITIQTCESAIFDDIDNAWDIFVAKHNLEKESRKILGIDVDLSNYYQDLKTQPVPNVDAFCGCGKFQFFKTEKREHFLSEHWVLPDLSLETIREAIAIWKTEQKQSEVTFCLNRQVEFLGERVYTKFLKHKLLDRIYFYFQQVLKKRAESTLTKEEAELILRISFVLHKDDHLLEQKKQLQNKIASETPDFYNSLFEARQFARQELENLAIELPEDLINQNTENILWILNTLLQKHLNQIIAACKMTYPSLNPYWI